MLPLVFCLMFYALVRLFSESPINWRLQPVTTTGMSRPAVEAPRRTARISTAAQRVTTQSHSNMEQVRQQRTEELRALSMNNNRGNSRVPPSGLEDALQRIIPDFFRPAHSERTHPQAQPEIQPRTQRLRRIDEPGPSRNPTSSRDGGPTQQKYARQDRPKKKL